MEDKDRLRAIARCFGSARKLEERCKCGYNTLSQKMRGKAPITPRDWFVVNTAIQGLIAELQALSTAHCGESSRKQGAVGNAEEGV